MQKELRHCKRVNLNFLPQNFSNFSFSSFFVPICSKAISNGYKKAIEMLIEKGADVNVADKTKTTPLHSIALYDSSFPGYEKWTEDDLLSNIQNHLR